MLPFVSTQRTRWFAVSPMKISPEESTATPPGWLRQARAAEPSSPQKPVCGPPATVETTPFGSIFRIRLPLLLGPVLIACAIGFAVSVGQYLPTVFAGNGRIATLTTDAVTLAGGADRRVIGTYAVLQALLPLLVYIGAVAVPAWRLARR